MNITQKIIHSVTQLATRSKTKSSSSEQVTEKEVELILQNLRAKIVFGILFVVLAGAILYLLHPYFSAIFFAVLFAVLMYPWYRFFYRKTRSKRLSTIITTLVLFAIIVIPFAFILSRLAAEITTISTTVSNISTTTSYQTTINNINSITAKLPLNISQAQIDSAISNLTQSLGNRAVAFTSNLVKSVISFGINVMIFTVLFVYLLPRMAQFKKFSLAISPLGSDITHDYIDKVRLLMRGTVVGSFVISLTASTIMGLTFWLLGIPNAVFLACIAFVLGFIPYLGTTIFTFGGAIIFALMGNYFNAGVLLLVQLVILNQLDLVFRPITLPKKVRIHPSLTILAVTAGLAVFGVMGIFYGIIILVLFISTVQIYKQNYGMPVEELK